jgi:hypothetical protein
MFPAQMIQHSRFASVLFRYYLHHSLIMSHTNVSATVTMVTRRDGAYSLAHQGEVIINAIFT